MSVAPRAATRRTSGRSSISARNGSRSTTTTISRTGISRPSKATRATARWRGPTPRSAKAPKPGRRPPISTSASRSSARPRDCLEKIAELQRLTGLDHLVTEYSFGAMPHEEAELNMRLFADKVLPIIAARPGLRRRRRAGNRAGPVPPGSRSACSPRPERRRSQPSARTRRNSFGRKRDQIRSAALARHHRGGILSAGD